MAKMITIEQRAVGIFNWDADEQARIERNVFAQDGRFVRRCVSAKTETAGTTASTW